MAIFMTSYTIQDDAGARQTMNVPIPQGSLTLADVADYMSDLMVLADEVTEGQFVKAGFYTAVTLPGGLDAPLNDSAVQKGGLFTFNANGTIYRHGIRIPAMAEAKITGGQIDVTDTDVAAFINAITVGLTPNASLVAPSDPYENDLTTLSEARLSFRK